jgi:voltage-gated potassium channel
MSLLRSMLLAVALLVAYFLLPFSSRVTTGNLFELLLGLLAVAALLTWQVLQIARSPYPMAKAIGALMVTLPLFLVVFAATYYLMGQANPRNFSEPLTRLDSLYFVTTTFATVGFGDITAVTQEARAVTTVQMVGDIVLVGLVARVVLGAAQEAMNRQGLRRSK